jgi:S1-C subfamily serine protease
VYLGCRYPGRSFIKSLSAAQNGDAEAQYEIGMIHYRGDYVHWDNNYPEAAKWLREAARQGHPPAKVILGDMYFDGLGVPKDNNVGAMYYREAAEQGYERAQYWLGVRYATGDGIARDKVLAYKWLTLALRANKDISRDRVESAIAKVATQMTAQEIAIGQRFVADFVQRKEQAPGATEHKSGETGLKATGSGFFISDDGALVTSYHVVKGASRVSVKTRQASFPAKIRKFDSKNDIAILEVSGSGFRSLPVASSSSAKLGEPVLTVGFPNPDLQGLEPKLTDGKISSLAGARDDARHFQISVAVQPGNSGGALINQAGNVIGVITGCLSEEVAFESSGALPQNVNYAVKSSYVLALLEGMEPPILKLKEPWPGKLRNSDDVVKEAQEAAVLVLVY